MAEDTPTASAPAGEPAPAERAPDTETKSAAAAESAPETSQEKGSEKVNESEKEKPSGKFVLLVLHFFLFFGLPSPLLD